MTHARRAALAAFLARPEIASVLAALDGAGEEARIVGGAVRNLLLGEPVGDCDIATTCLPDETARRGATAGFRPVPTGIEHGTVTLVRDGVGFEVTTLRRDVETDGRHAKVVFGRDFAEDALRRDFTVNALSLDAGGRVFDYASGLADLAERRIRFIGEPAARIREDYLRILRFFRFHAQYGHGEPDRDGLRACIAGRGGLASLSRERVRAETMKLVAAPGAVRALEAMAGAGLLLPVIGGVPHLARFAAVAAGGAGDVFPAFRLAALAVLVREDALRLRETLRLSNEEFDRIARLAAALGKLGGRCVPPDASEARLIALDTGGDAVAGALTLLALPSAMELIAALARTPPFLPTGKDVLALGMPAGPAVGRALLTARRAWIEAGCPAGKDAQMAFVAAEAAG